MGKKHELTGRKIGQLTVIEECGRTPNGFVLWKCLCSCGNTTKVRSVDLVKHSIVSCGCYRKVKDYKHGDSKRYKGSAKEARLYRIWRHMIERCYNTNTKAYKRYGGRGIGICTEWKHDYPKFKAWALLNGYRDDLSIDRIDVNGNYCPENCRWATQKQQTRNTRRNVFVEIGGVSKCVAEWAEFSGLSPATIRSRINRGWKGERIISPSRKMKWRKKDEKGYQQAPASLPRMAADCEGCRK